MTKGKNTIFISLIIVSTILATYFFSFSVQHPYIGALIQKDNEYRVVETEPRTWSSRNLNVGDVILSVNGLSPSKSMPIQKWGMLEQAKFITIKDVETGEIETLQVETEMDTQMLFQLIIPAIVFLLTLYISYIINRSQKESTKGSSLMLILFLLDIALAYIGGGASARGEYVARSAVTSFFVLVPIFYLHFIYLYFKELNSTWFSKKWIWFTYFLAFINMLVNILTFSDAPLFGISVIHAKALNLLSFMFIFIMAFGLIFIGLKKITYKAQRYLIKVLIYSIVIAFLPFLLLYVVPYVVFNKILFSPVFLASFLLIIPFTLVYQFLAQKIYDVEFLIGRLRYYLILGLFPSIFGVFFIVFLKSDNATIFTIRTFIVFLLMMFIGFYLKEIIDFRFNLKRMSEKRNYQESIFEFTQKIRSANEFDEVISELKSAIIDTLLVKDTYIVELKKDLSLVNIYPNNESIFKTYEENLRNATEEVGMVIEEKKGFILNIGETQTKNYLLLALEQTNTPRLTRDELSWLKTLAYYTNVTIESFLKIEQFMEHLEHIEQEGSTSTLLNRVIYQLEEKQRSLLAKDLHDSVLQDLLSIKRKIEMNVYAEPQIENPSECITVDHLQKAQKKILDDMNRVIKITRETCHELRPNVLYDLGLEKAIKRLVEQHISANKYNIRFTSNKVDEGIPDEVQLNLYRITQELLNNTKKHSNAQNIVLMLVKIKDKIVLHYEDDGIGADPNKLFADTGSIGLSGVRERVKMLNGTINVKTAINEGFLVDIEI